MSIQTTLVRGQHECEAIDQVFAILDAMGLQHVNDRQTSDSQEADPDNDVPWVLHIDDDPDFSWGVKMRLEERGIVVIRAFDGMDGYRTVFQHPATAILLDIEMPNGRGDYVLRRLKENPVTAGIPVIVISGLDDEMMKRKMLNLGAYAILGKPVDYDVLLDRLADHIRLMDAPVD
ncbi:MAG: DNA-binding response OmpR family regulator [Pirellulaceae bacterium]|jgi:DNA-binding response OmpR family regulator